MSRWAKVCALLAALTAGACTSALADTFTFSYTDGATVNALGTLTGTLTGINANEYQITGISGSRNGSVITGLLVGSQCNTDFGSSCDNLFYYPANSGLYNFSNGGLGYTTADATQVNLYSAAGGNYEVANPGSQNAITFSATAVPGPLPGAGRLSYLVVLVGGAWRWRKTVFARARVTASSALHSARSCYRRLRPARSAASRAV